MAAQNTSKQKVTFSFAGSDVESVALAGDFTGWQQAPLAFKKQKNGIWKKTVSLPPGRYEYRLLVNGQWRDDPQCGERVPNQYGGENCICIVAEPSTAQANDESDASRSSSVG
jgi:1,4-alpha-glucan branching enzyme